MRQRRGVVQRLSRALASLVYRDIDVVPWDQSLNGRPILAVSNHFGGLSDGILLIDSAPEMPRIVARDVIWRVPVVGRLASSIGMIPVHRAADGQRSSNDEMFASAYQALAENQMLLIFPEGVTQDEPYMATVRTGAARIALGARASGVAGIQVLPIGLHYEDKAGFRARVLVNPGAAIDLDEWVAARPDDVQGGAEDRQAVTALTATIDSSLRRAAPDFPDWRTVSALHLAARVLLADVDASVPSSEVQYGDVELLADRLDRAPEPQRGEILTASQAYGEALRAAGTSDSAVLGGGSTRFVWTYLRRIAALVVLLPLAVIGLVVAAIPLAVISLVSRLRVAPAVRSSLVPAVALLMFLVEWLALFAFFGFDADWDLGTAMLLLFPFFVGAFLVFAEQAVLFRDDWRSRRRPPPEQLAHLQDLRAVLSRHAWSVL